MKTETLLQMMTVVFSDPSTCEAAAHSLVHALSRIISNFLFNKSSAYATNPGGIRVTVHHVAIVIATMQGALEWLETLPKPLRHVPTQQCFCFQNEIKYFLIRRSRQLFLIMKVYNFQGDLTDVSARRKACPYTASSTWPMYTTVILFSKLNQPCLGYDDLININFHRKNS